MDYEKKYKDALERARQFSEHPLQEDSSNIVEYIFPELKESEDEKMMHQLHSWMKEFGGAEEYTEKVYTWLKSLLEKQGEPEDMGEVSDGYHTFNELYYYRMLYNAAFFNRLPKDWVHKSKRHHDGEECFGGGWFIVMANLPTGQISNHYELKDWDLFQIPEKDIADEWDGHTPQEAAERLHKFLLEKQGEQEPTDKVEPKFHEGEWITNGDYTWKIVEVKPLDYILQSQDGNIVDDTISHVDVQFHSFTIEDAKDGDVLASNRSIFIFSQEYIAGKPEAHCGIMNGLFLVKPEGCWTNEECYPATKEQRDLLFQKMVEPGWEWDSEKNELKKIEQKPTNENPTDVGHEYYSELLNNDDSDTIDEYAYQCAYCMSHDWMKETATWEDVQKAVKLGAEWQKHKSTWSEEDKNFMYDTLSNLTELKDRYGKDYGNVGKCMDWLKSLKQRIGGEV